MRHIHQRLLKGVRDAARVVRKTYGPKGKHVLIQRREGLLITQDGASVIWELSPEDPVERIAVQLVQQACHQISQTVGDGTSTTALLIHSILEEVFKYPDKIKLAEELEATIKTFNLEGQEASEEVLLEIGTRACKGDFEASKAILEALMLAGDFGLVVVEEGKSRTFEIEIKEGLEFDNIQGLGIENETVETPLVAVFDSTLLEHRDVQAVLEEATQFHHPLIIFSRGCYGKAFNLVQYNNNNLKREDGSPYVFQCVTVPGHANKKSEWLKDIAALTGATIVNPYTKSFQSEWFGSAQKIHKGNEKIRIYSFPDKVDFIEKRIIELEEQKDLESTFDIDEINRRIAMLCDGFCLLKVGGVTPLEIKEKKSRIEDGLSAVQSAFKTGVTLKGDPFLQCNFEFSSPRCQKIVHKVFSTPAETLNLQDRPVESKGLVEAVVKTSFSTALEILRTEVALCASPPFNTKRPA